MQRAQAGRDLGTLAERDHDLLLYVSGILRDEVAERGVAVVADRLVEARDGTRRRADLLDVLDA